MHPIDCYSLQQLAQRNLESEYQRQLFFNDVPTQTVVNGDEIAFQYRFGRLGILATRYDYFEGTQHWIYALNCDHKIIDALSLPESNGFIDKIDIRPNDGIHFSTFNADHAWLLTVTESGKWSFNLHALSLRLNRFMLMKRYIHLRPVSIAMR